MSDRQIGTLRIGKVAAELGCMEPALTFSRTRQIVNTILGAA